MEMAFGDMWPRVATL